MTVILPRHQLEMPGHYSHLEAFYDDKKGVLPDSKGTPTSQQPVHWLPSIHRYMYPEMKITHPAGCMSQFIKFFGEQILVLWKFALLRKRILIFSPPPVGVVCYRVYCCCCLANVSLPGLGGTVPESKPFFYVNVADIEMLETEVSYVACTTEKIFEEKRDLYDVYVDNQNVKTHHEHLQPLLKINNADKEKYRRLNDQRQMLMYSQEVGEDCSSCEEDLFILFFMEQNNRIFQTLMEVSASQDKTLTADHARGMGLDPQGDRSFLMDLLEVKAVEPHEECFSFLCCRKNRIQFTQSQRFPSGWLPLALDVFVQEKTLLLTLPVAHNCNIIILKSLGKK